MTIKEKEEFKKQLKGMSKDDLRTACNQYIWLSSYANNNPRSAYHWKCDMTYDECKERGLEHIYSEEWEKLAKQT